MIANKNNVDRVTFKAGDYLFKQGDESYFFFMIEDGEVEVFLNDKKGGEVPLAIIREGQPVGEFALITKKPRVASARAKTQVTAVQISEEGYRDLLGSLPDWAISFITELVERLKRTDERLAELQSRDGTNPGDLDYLGFSIKR